MSSPTIFHARALAWLRANHAYAPEPADAPMRVDNERPFCARSSGTRVLGSGEGRNVQLPVLLLFVFTGVGLLVSIRAGVGETVALVARIGAFVCLAAAIAIIVGARRPELVQVDILLVGRTKKNEPPLEVRSVEPLIAGVQRPTWIVGEVGFAPGVPARVARPELRWFAEHRGAFVEIRPQQRGGRA